MAKWVNGERPKPPIDTSAVEDDLRSYAFDLRIGGRSKEEVAVAMHNLASACLDISRELDLAPKRAALASIRQTVRRALAPPPRRSQGLPTRL